MRILVINPGGASTKLSVFEDDKEIASGEAVHDAKVLKSFPRTVDQASFRTEGVRQFLKENGIDEESLDAVAVRGGAFMPMPSGTYRVTQKIIDQVLRGEVMTDHASNLGVLMGDEIARPLGIPCFFTDPVCVDEFIPESRLSGHPLLPRVSLFHALNIKHVIRIAAERSGKKPEEMNMVVSHLGTGISVVASRRGRVIDVSNANDGGPFSPQRTGALPVTGLVKLCFSGKYTEKEVMAMLIKEGGVYAYLGTYDFREVMERMDKGEELPGLVYRAMIIQIAKEMGAMASVLAGQVDLQVITGGIAFNERFVSDLRAYIDWIGPVMVIPGEMEMEALAAAALRVLRGEEEAREL
ncbi:MAG: butyrate kinase [candidate division WOR-3 bacterium]